MLCSTCTTCYNFNSRREKLLIYVAFTDGCMDVGFKDSDHVRVAYFSRLVCTDKKTRLDM